MNNSNQNGALEVKYDAFHDETTEIVPYAVIYVYYEGGTDDVILEIGGERSYKGKAFTGDCSMVFHITEHCDHPSKPTNKIVFLIDGERLEVETTNDLLNDGDQCAFSHHVIDGWEDVLDWYSDTSTIRTMDINFTTEDIKRIANAKDVKVYLDSKTLYDANGGKIEFIDDDDDVYSLRIKIEGIQGFMKRVYHYFVDDACYADYCTPFLEREQKLVDETEQWIKTEEKKQEQKRQAMEQEEIEEEERWYRARRRNIIIIIASIIITFLCGFFGDLDWIGAIAGVIIFVCGFRLYSIGAIGGGGDGNEE